MIVGSTKVIIGSTEVIVCSTKVIVGSTKVYLVYNGQSGGPGDSRAIQRALQGYLATFKINCCFFPNRTSPNRDKLAAASLSE